MPKRARREMKIAILRNITAEPLVRSLGREMPEVHFEFHIGDYGTVVQDALAPASYLSRFQPDLILVYQSVFSQYPALVDSFASTPYSDISRMVDEMVESHTALLAGIRRHTKAPIILHSLEIPPYPAYGVLDSQKEDGQVNTIRRANARILTVALQWQDVFLVDMTLLQSRLGWRAFFDPRMWHLARNPYSGEAWAALAGEYAKYIRAFKGLAKKCIVVDCDNTLWGGIVGEDGISGIALGGAYPGSAYLALQKALLDYYKSGILLAICSKNNEADVLEVLDQHPEMVLRRDHFVARRINWKDKATNTAEIAQELNIGLDSLVFLDDNPAEIEALRTMLPDVTAIHLHGDPVSFADQLRSSGLFDRTTITDEDRNRSAMYVSENARKVALQSSLSLDDYYRGLEMALTIAATDDGSISRVAQLTQKTNQFNLTTRRYTVAQLAELAHDPCKSVIYARLQDKFGDNGIIGVSILQYEGTTCSIDTFLLSCRVIGRGIEDFFLQECIKAAQRRRCTAVYGTYRPTKKNGQTETFYPNHGFSPVDAAVDERRYVLALENYNPPEMKHYLKSIDSLV